MKIGFDSKRLFCNFTGLGNYSRTLLRNLVLYYPDHEYVLYTTEVRENPETQFFLDNPDFQIRIPNTQFHAWWRTFSIKNQLLAGNIELFHGLSHELPVNIHKTGIRSIVTIHDLIFKVYPETYATVDRKIYDLKFRHACNQADRIIAISANTKKDIVQYYHIDPEKIDVIYQACSPSFYKLRTPFENERVMQQYELPREYLLSVGNIEPRKNLKKVIEALPWVNRDIQIPLVVVGRGGKYKEETMQIARRSGLKSPVIWIDNLTSNEHLQSLYQNAQALLYPSLYEGFGLPVLEALLCKTPVITSDRSSLKEAGGPSSIYVNPKEPEEIAGAIEKVLKDSAFRRSMSETGYLYAHQNFAPEKITRQMMDCYLKTVKGG